MIYQHIPDKLNSRLEKMEQELIAQISSSGVIENALLLGSSRQTTLLQSCRSQYHHLVCENFPRSRSHSQVTQIQVQPQIYLSHFTDLPFAKESMDFIILPHALEFSTEPKRVLEEACECLSKRGSLLIFSLSPFSRFVPLFNQNNKFHFSPLSLSITKQLITEAGLEVTSSQSFFSMLSYAPDTKFTQFLDKIVMPYLPFLCHAYWVIAQKTSIPYTQIPLKSYTTQRQTIALESGCAARSGNS